MFTSIDPGRVRVLTNSLDPGGEVCAVLDAVLTADR